jgi:AraC family transcriptional regulator
MHSIQPRIMTVGSKKLIGQRLTMSLADYRIGELWKSFAAKRNQIVNALNNDLISMAIYQPHHFASFHPTNEFERWATVEVENYDLLPAGLETFDLPSGLYAVFDYQGLSTDTSIFQYILGTWLPASEFVLDNRPHFEVLGEKYKNNDPKSEEEIYIPIKAK